MCDCPGGVGKGLPFFLPRRLIEFEYFSSDEADQEYMEIAEPYQKDIDFAFFVVNFGYSRSDYDALTPREIAFMRKAWESKMVADSYNMYNADFTAYFNANRPKRKKALKLWNKKKVKKADMEVIRDNLKIIRDVEKTEGTGWVDAIYKANNLPSIRRC